MGFIFGIKMPKYILRNQADRLQAEQLAKECNINKIVAGLLLARGIDTAAAAIKFLQPDLAELCSPFDLIGIREACKLIRSVIACKGKIVIYADYDADGVGAAAILHLAFKEIGIVSDVYIPNRKNEGYGLTVSALKLIKEQYNPRLIITVDCGISAIEEVAFAKEQLGIDIIVTDHHEPQAVLPNAICINPHLVQGYPPLCGAGVALKLAEALCGQAQAMQYLDICAISTVADMVPLIADNRIIAAYGLRLLAKKQTRIGLRMLMERIGIGDELSSYDIAFKIAPRLNAVGRLDSANSAFRLLVSQDTTELSLLVEELELANTVRQELCEKTFEHAKEKLLAYNLFEGGIIALEDKSWDSGIVGIVAAKLCEEFKRPVILFSHQDGLLKGSARSINGANIFLALKSAQDLLISFGGHSMAAGASLGKDNLKALACSIDRYFAKQNITFAEHTYSYDFALASEAVDLQLAAQLKKMQPFGLGNPAPCFLTEYTANSFSRMAKHKHILSRSKNITLLGFNMLNLLEAVNGGAEIIYNIELDYFRNKPIVNGIIKSIKVSRLPNAEVLLSRYFSLYNVKSFKYRGKRRKPQKDFGHIVIAYSKEGFDKACALYPFYNQSIFTLGCSNPVNTVILSPDKELDFSYYGEISFADKLPKGFASIVNASYGKVKYLSFAAAPYVDSTLSVPLLRQYYLIMKKLLSGKEDNVTALYNRVAARHTVTLSDFSLAYNIFKELALICTDKNDIIYFSKEKVELCASQLYLQTIKDKVDYAEAACASENKV